MYFWMVAEETFPALDTKIDRVHIDGIRCNFAYFSRKIREVKFDTVGEDLYRQAVNLMLGGIDPALAVVAKKDGTGARLYENWPTSLRSEAIRYQPENQQLLTAIYWPAVPSGFQRELAPAGLLIVAERELVVITEEKKSPRQHSGDLHKFGGVITYFPSVRLGDFHVGHHERFGVLALQVNGNHGGEKLEIIFPSDHEGAVRKAMQLLLGRNTI
jgi:hypothetical protein